MFGRVVSGLARVGTGVGIANTIADFGQNRHHYQNGNISQKEFHWRTFVGVASNIPCNFMRTAIISEDLWNKVQDGNLGVGDTVSAMSSYGKVDVMGIVKAGGNIFNCANFMLESQNVLNHMGDKTGNEVIASLTALTNEWAGPVGSTRSDFRQ